MTTPNAHQNNPNAISFLRLAALCEEQLVACKNADLERIAKILTCKEHLLTSIDFAQLDPQSEQMNRAAGRIMQCDSESAESLQKHHRGLGETLERLRNGRTARHGYTAPIRQSERPQLLDIRE